MRLEQRAMTRLRPGVAGLDAVDLGCGSGRYLRLLRTWGARRCLGIDPARAMLARCRGLPAHLACAGLPHVPLRSATFDVALCGLVLGHVEDLEAALREVARILRPGGRLLYSDVHPEGARQGWRRTFVATDGREYAVRHFVHPVERHLQALAAAGFVVEATAEPRVEEAAAWRGTRALLVVRARRSDGAGSGA
jgi:malonyl-CoA O-methyltransferase